MKVFFFKALVANPLIINGAPVPFEILDRNNGIIALDSDKPSDVPIIVGLEECARKGQAGVSKLNNEAEYLEKKNLLPYSGKFKYDHEQPLKVLAQQSPKPADPAVAADITKLPSFQAAVKEAVAVALAAQTKAPAQPETQAIKAAQAASEPASPAPVSPDAAPVTEVVPAAASAAAPSFTPPTRRIGAANRAKSEKQPSE